MNLTEGLSSCAWARERRVSIYLFCIQKKCGIKCSKIGWTKFSTRYIFDIRKVSIPFFEFQLRSVRLCSNKALGGFTKSQEKKFSQPRKKTLWQIALLGVGAHDQARGGRVITLLQDISLYTAFYFFLNTLAAIFIRKTWEVKFLLL